MSDRSDALRRFYKDKRVLVTGHTGLKGSWLALWLARMGARVSGIALPPPSERSFFTANAMDELVASEFLDVRDRQALRTAVARIQPEIVFHLAAQAIVGVSYDDPATTFEINVLGSINVLDCVRSIPGVQAAVMITSDKCYENVEQIWGYREQDGLGGDDPYSASKACAEVAIHAYRRSFFNQDPAPRLASARAGNVIGGGDWSPFRLIPDCIRALREARIIQIRNPRATRPWQFVLEPLCGYLTLAMHLAENREFAGAWNFGPPVDTANTVERGAREVIRVWGDGHLELVPNMFHESLALQLDCTKAHHYLGWRTVLDFLQTMEWTTAWYKHQHATGDGSMREFSCRQIETFERLLDDRLRLQ